MLDLEAGLCIIVNRMGRSRINLKFNNNKDNKKTHNKITRKRGIMGTLSLLMALTFPTAVLAEDLNSLNSKINNVNNQIATKRNEKTTIENEIAIIDAQIQKVSLEIDATNSQINQLASAITETTNQITKAETDLKTEQEKMKEYLRVMYEQDQESMVELVIKSETFSDFVDQKEYLSSMQMQIKESADRIAALKKQLEEKKTQLEADKVKAEQLKANQVAQQQAVQAQKAYKDTLLAQANNALSGLQNQLGDLYAKKAAMSTSYGEGIYRGSSAYPFGNPPARNIIDTPDPWGYLIGECTSYAAWKRASVGRPVPRGLGNAKTWGTRASAMGYSVDSLPRVGDVIVMPYLGGYGHVAYVEAVYGNGTVLISEYNWVPFSFSTRVVNPYNYGAQFIH